VLAKCANPACGAKFRYLTVGKLFVVECRNSGPGDGSAPGPELAKRFDRLRYFWLCQVCSQVTTIQTSSGGGIRLAPVLGVDVNEQQGPRVAFDAQEMASTALGGRRDMRNAKHKLGVLMRELEFLENGGYRLAMGWRPPFIFEDSPTCPRLPFSACPNTACALKDFVPEERRNQTIPCRHIPLNETDETLHTLYSTATNGEIEQVLWEWLHKTIAELEQATRSQSILLDEESA
jgi:hypothetical protein